MRYQDAYDLISTSLEAQGMVLPDSSGVKGHYFDTAVENIGMRVVRKKDVITYTASGREYVIDNDDITNSIYKVEVDKKIVPFVPDKQTVADIVDSKVSHIGYYLKTDVGQGVITDITEANPGVITSTGHGLVTGDYVVFYDFTGVTKAGGNDYEGKRYKVTYISDDTFSVPVDTSSGYTMSSEAGYYEKDTKKIVFTKTPDSGDSIKVYYYAKPRPKVSNMSKIDLPTMLIDSAVYTTLSHYLAMQGNLQLSSGYKGMAKSIEKEYLATDYAREANIDILPSPLQDFVDPR